jgi:hypothetical protein
LGKRGRFAEVSVFPGGMAEWSKAAVLKTVERKFRGFESYSLRQQLAKFSSIVYRGLVNRATFISEPKIYIWYLRVRLPPERWPSRLKALAC